MKINGRRVCIAGSASLAADPALLKYAHELVARLVAELTSQGGLVLCGAGKNPRLRDDLDQPPVIFDWTILETVLSQVKHGGITYVDGLSDVDALVILKETHIDGDSPEGLIAQFAEKLQARFGRGEGIVKQGRLAVTLRIDGKEIQLLPAMRIGDGFKIASSDGRGLAKINPKNFSEKLTKANQSLDGKLIPTIKLAKSIIANLPEQRQLSGYHTESLAINVFKGYGGPKNVKDMLKHFFNSAAEYCKKPIKDSTGQSVHVDEYLGEDNSLPRLAIADALGRIGRRLANADGAHSLEQWRVVLNID